MAYDENLAKRITTLIADIPGFDEKKMFGGVGYLINGNMACGVHKLNLVVRVGPAAHDAAMNQPHTVPFDFTGRPMTGWLLVTPEGTSSDESLHNWVWKGIEFAQTLPPK